MWFQSSLESNFIYAHVACFKKDALSYELVIKLQYIPSLFARFMVNEYKSLISICYEVKLSFPKNAQLTIFINNLAAHFFYCNRSPTIVLMKLKIFFHRNQNVFPSSSISIIIFWCIN